MDYCNRITGQTIRGLRLKKGMTQEVLAGLAGIARGHLALIESGRKSAGVEVLWRVSEALDMRLSELIQMVEEKHLRKE